jgi:hypothetical protein
VLPAEYRPLAEELRGLGEFFQRLSSAPPRERRRLLEKVRWLPLFVEASYRGEFAAARAARKKPSVSALRAVADATGLTPRRVERLCAAARRAQQLGEPAVRPLRASHLRHLLETGTTLPE